MSTSHIVQGDGIPDWTKAGPITSAPPFDRPTITVRCYVDDVEQLLPGRAIGWTSTLVHAEVDHEGQHYWIWVTAGRVTRRDIAATPDTP